MTQPAARKLSPFRSPIRWTRAHAAELTKFGTVGAVAFVVDLGLYNLVLFVWQTPFSQNDKVVTAKVFSALCATLVAWIGNRLWTFRERRTHRRTRELVGFGVVNAVALALAAAAVAFARYVMGETGPLALNVAAVVGIGLGTVARYVGYKKFVFVGARASEGAGGAST